MRMRSGERCKENCTAYSTALDAVKILHAQCKELTTSKKDSESLATLSALGYLILGVDEAKRFSVATVIRPDGDDDRKVQLYSLPYDNFSTPLCDMDITYKPETRSAYIIDWHSKYENEGYGSILMTRLIAFLRMSGFLYLTGIISFVDFGHEDKLRHFYTKFGFEITDHPNKRTLKLSLR